uniref:Uncharacterized protein n=1 Tax=Helianthus annuus TaxID=4232 RepID=A0A251VHY6_HELAN
MNVLETNSYVSNSGQSTLWCFCATKIGTDQIHFILWKNKERQNSKDGELNQHQVGNTGCI